MTDKRLDPLPPAPASPGTSSSRDQRLAAKLRENLHRRKAQARGLVDPPAAGLAGVSADGPGALSKLPEKS